MKDATLNRKKSKATLWFGKVIGSYITSCTKFMDYYYQTILPATDIPQELKDAWVYQAKKSGIWK